MMEIIALGHLALAKLGVLGLAALWALKAGAGWLALRWLRSRRGRAASD